MLVKDVMTKNVEYIHSDSSLKDAAERMHRLDCGFLPIANSGQEKLRGVITDRDIAVRAVAEGFDPTQTTVDEIKTDKVLYCFEDDSLSDAAVSMSEQKVYRLIVLNNRNEKKMTGIISLGDIVRHNEEKLAGSIAKGIAA